MGISIIGASMSGSPTSTTSVRAPLPTTALTLTAVATNDTSQALTVTGRRFLFEYRFLVNNTFSGSPSGGNLAWTGTATGCYAEVEFVSTTPYVSRNTTNQSALNSTSPVAIYTAPNVVVGPVVFSGVLEFASTVTTTLTPGVITSTGVGTAYFRTFRVDTIS